MISALLSSFRKNHRQWLYSIFAPIVGVLLIWVAEQTGALKRLENLTLDWRFRMRCLGDAPADPALIFVKIDEDSLKEWGAWPWTRAIHGDFLQLANLSDPAVVAFDLFFPESQTEASDLHFSQSLAKIPCAITGAVSAHDPNRQIPENLGPTRPIERIDGDIRKIHDSKGALLPIEILRKNSYFGFVDADPSSLDGIRRELPMLVRIGERIFPSLTLQTLCLYWGVSPDQVKVQLGHAIHIPAPQGEVRVPIDHRGRFSLNYRNSEGFYSIGYKALCKALADFHVGNKPWPSTYSKITGKILVIGQSAVGLSDLGPSPMEGQAPLALVHLNALNNILQRDFLRKVSLRWILFLWLVASWTTLLGLQKSKILPSIIIPSLFILAYIALGFQIFSKYSFEAALVSPILGFTIIHAGAITLRWHDEQKSKRHIKQVLGSYIAPAVMDQLLKHPENLKLGGTRKPVTILFSDIRGFTSISESGDEAELVRQLNEYFSKMVDCVNQYQGTLHKYIGDAIMAVWGDVIDADESANARNAVRTSLAMRRALLALNALWASENRMELKIGIGLNHGHVVVGNIGAPQRKEFTVIGDAVNLASRLEGVTKQFHTDFVIGETVQALLGDEFLTRTVGFIIVKGKTQPIRVYEVLDDFTRPQGLWPPSWVSTYEKGFAAFINRQFGKAIQHFESCDRERPRDFCVNAYLKSCREFLENPPPSDWKGIITMETK